MLGFLVFLHVFSGVCYGGFLFGVLTQIVLMMRRERPEGDFSSVSSEGPFFVVSLLFLFFAGCSVLFSGSVLVSRFHFQDVEYVLKARELMLCSFFVSVLSSLYSCVSIFKSVSSRRIMFVQSALFLVAWIFWCGVLYHMIARV